MSALSKYDIVRDKENLDKKLIVTRVTDEIASQSIVYDNESLGMPSKMVADFPENDTYPDDDIVIECIFFSELKQSEHGKSISTLIENNEIRVYSYPETRLQLEKQVDISASP